MSFGLSELSKKGDLRVPVGGKGKDGNDPYLDGGKVTVDEFRLVGELEDDPVIGPQAPVNEMEREPIHLFSHLRVGNVASPVCKRDSMSVSIYPFIKLFPECFIDPVTFCLVFSYEGFRVRNKTF